MHQLHVAVQHQKNGWETWDRWVETVVIGPWKRMLAINNQLASIEGYFKTGMSQFHTTYVSK